MLTPLLLALTAPALTACNSSSSASAPTIEDISTRYRTNHVDYSIQAGADSTFTSTLQVYVSASSSGSTDDITLVEAQFAGQGRDIVHDQRSSTDADDRVNGLFNGYFRSLNYYSTGDQKNRRELEGHRVFVTNSDGRTTSREFELTIPEGWASGHESFVYDNEYDEDDKTDGIPGLGPVEVDDLKITADEVSFDLSTDENETEARSESMLIQFFKKDEDNDSYYPLANSRRVLQDDGEYTTDGQPTEVQLARNDEDDIVLSHYAMDNNLDLEDATHYFLVHHGPPVDLMVDGAALRGWPFLYWSGWIEVPED
ncbi:hypothetical protein E4656_10325 [Natronospirillum operosum]|uniref:Uncharacterized protein n=1 Tax=Natronospirillum operosum TaxID=2759953 RepID=A0A4Z0WE41_9GAMM|nr:hypothetical protein [Natronospirillum operosum]TGG93436.1 hypothetical protein E4656_10325 [Natronospirillum operosum]